MTLDGVECWASSPSKYVNEAVGNVEKYLKELRDPRSEVEAPEASA